MQRLQDGLTSIHPFMPTFRFNIALEVLNYMKSIQEPSKPKYPPARSTEPLVIFVTGNGYGLHGVPSCCWL